MFRSISNKIISLKIELIVFAITLISLKFFIGITATHINSDGVGYYDYLPSIFIHNDLIRNNNNDFIRLDTTIGYVNVEGKRINKYTPGVAILLSPFFSIAYLTSKFSKEKITGYEPVFHRFVFYATLFYFLAGLIFFRKTLDSFNLEFDVKVIVIALTGLSTNIIQYLNREASFSHVYCFFLIAAIIYFLRKYFTTNNQNYVLIISTLLGLLYLTRPVDLIVVFAIPLIAGNYKSLTKSATAIITDKSLSMKAILILLIALTLHFVTNYLQTGKWYIDTYQNEHFNFLKPEILNVLFSYRKGLFIYTPSLFLCLVALIYLLYKREIYISITWLFFFAIIVYVLSSWENWWYSCGYGQRAFIGFLPVLFLIVAIGLNGTKRNFKRIVFIVGLLFVAVNHIQARQYKNYILDWENMNKIKYWNVFLSNSNRFIGFNSKKYYNDERLKKTKSFKLYNQEVRPNNKAILIETDLKKIEPNSILKFSCYSAFEKSNRAKLKLILNNTNSETVFNKTITFSNLSNIYLGEYSQGSYFYELPNYNRPLKLIISLETDEYNVLIKNANVCLYNSIK